MTLDVDRVLGETFIRHIEHRDETRSTNDLAIELANQGESRFPFLTITDRQTQGRGRGTNQWWASDGALTFTVMIDAHEHDLASRNWPKLSLTIGLSVCETLEGLVPDRRVELKWPNDVYLERKKLCGVLIETVSERRGLIVIGIGINVNNSLHDASEELRAKATSLIDESGQRFDLTDVLLRQLRSLENCIQRIAVGEAELAESLRSRCMLEGHTVVVEFGKRKITGVCHGIDDDGALLLQSEGGIERCVAGVVSQIL